MSKLWIGLEILLVCVGVWRISCFVKAYRKSDSNLPAEVRIEEMVNSQIKNKLAAAFLKRDLLIIYFLFSKSKKGPLENVYTLHQKNGYGGIVFGLIFVLVLEGVGISYLLHIWSMTAVWIHLALSVYTIAFFISDYKAIKRNPVVLLDDMLQIRMGMRGKMDISLGNIECIQNGKMNYENDKKRKDVWNLILFGFDEPDFEITFNRPIIMRDGFGRDIKIIKIYLSLDEKERFYSQIKAHQPKCGTEMKFS